MAAIRSHRLDTRKTLSMLKQIKCGPKCKVWVRKDFGSGYTELLHLKFLTRLGLLEEVDVIYKHGNNDRIQQNTYGFKLI